MNVQPSHEQVDSIFERYLKPGSPGCALAVVRNGEIVYRQGYGLANLELAVPIVPSTVFNIGSTAKQFTAFAIALLEDEGKLSYDDDLRQVLPEMHDFGQTITLRHLIHHTSGLRGSFPELLALAEWRDTDATTTQDVYRLLKAQRELNYRPGDEYLYVNSNYVLLALICERVSGQSLATFCQERIFGPLGMTRSIINDSIVKLIPGRALGYYDDGQGNWINAPLTDSVVGPTNVYSSVEDLARWDENLFTGQVGGQAVAARMHQPGHLNDGTELEYAFGLMVGPAHQHRGWQVIEHGGGQGGYGSWLMRFPERHLSVIVLFNHFLWDMKEYALRVAGLFLEEKAPARMPVEPQADPEETAAAVELSAEQLEGKAGSYFDAQRAAIREITFTEGRLQYQGLDLVPLSEDLFFFEVDPQTRVEFIPAEKDAVAGIKTITTSGEYGYDRVETASPTPGELAQYAGRYYSPELDIFWTLEAGDDHLVAKRRKYVDSRLTPLFADAFSDDWLPLMDYPTTYLVVFERDEQDAITGLRVSGTRVRNLWFSKEAAPDPEGFPKPLGSVSKWTVGVAAAIVDEGRVLLVRHTYGEKAGCWAMPGGYAHPGERLDQAAVREVNEEVGLQTEVVDAIALVTRTSTQGGAVFVVFRLRILSGVATPDGVEVDCAGWFTADEVKAMGKDELWPDSRNPALAAVSDEPGLADSAHYHGRSETARGFITSAIANPWQ